MALIECKNLRIGYDAKTVIDDISFTVESGDYLCIIGENGSGKTTLMKTLLSLIPKIDGSIVFSDGLKNKEIGYLPQQTVIQKDFPASVFEVVLSGFCGKKGIKPFYTKKEKEIAKMQMERMEILNLKNRCYRELSGGQQQRVLLARALCAANKVLLLDEPVAGLDPKATEEMYSIIDNLNKKEKMTVIMISHDTASTKKYATKILHIGEKIVFDTKENYYKNSSESGGVK